MRLKVFPATILPDGQKVPLIKNWQTEATDDPEKIRQWQAFYRERIKIWGAPTGSINGIFVLDIDNKNGKNGYEALNKLGIQLPATAWQRTPSGGMHLIFRDDPALQLRNTANKDLGIDTRANGGWVGVYNPDFTNPIIPIPQWVLELTAKKVNHVDPSQVNTYQMDPTLAMRKFDEAITAIRNAGVGERNQTLNTQAFIIGQMVTAGAVPREYAYEEISKAALEIGLTPFEVQATTLSGLGGGFKHPLTHPFGDKPPVPAIPIVAPMPVLETVERWTPRFGTRQQLTDITKLRKPQLFESWSSEDIHLTSAIGGVGKTTLKLYEAICLATGEPFLGFKCLKPGRTLFVIGEDSEEKLYAMVGRICNQLGYFNPGNEHKIEAVLNNVVIKLATDITLVAQDPKTRVPTPNPEAIGKIQQAIEDLNPRQIIFDPIAMFWGKESDGNDMAMALAKAMQIIQRTSEASIDMITHIGKDSHSKRDVSQFSGRGATALANHSRVIRTMLSLNADEYLDMMGEPMPDECTAIQVYVSKFSDGSDLLNKPFVILRKGYLFERRDIPEGKQGATAATEKNRIMNFLRTNSTLEKPVTEKQIIDHFFLQNPKINKATAKAALGLLRVEGAVIVEQHPDVTVGEWIRVS